MPNYAPDGYYYVVSVYEALKYENVPTSSSSLNGWTPINSTKKVNTNGKALYRVSIYDGTAGLPGFIVRDDRAGGGSRLNSGGDFASFKTEIASIADISGIRTIDDRYYDFTVTPKKDGTVSPKLVPQVEINGIWRDVKIQTGSKIPSVIFTKAPTAPTVPSTVSAYDSFGKNGPYQWDACENHFVRLWHSNVTEVPVQGQSGTTVQQYTVSVKYFDKNGDPKGKDKIMSKQVNGITVNKEKATESHVPKSLTQQALGMLDKAKNCTNPSGGGGAGNGGATTPPATSTTIKSAETFNPPPHIMTRHFSPIAFGGKDSYDDGNSYNQLGMIYMDPDTVLNTAKVYTKKVTKFWGFRFIFNPTTFSYSMNSSNNVDWTRKNPNNAVLVADGVGGVITMRLIIDRVADMNTMRRWDLNGRQGIVGAPDYPTTLTPEQCAGILNRGTEYDLEYMFRVFNGNPELSTLLGNSKQDLEMATANLGYMTALPFVLKLNDQLRYKVNVTGITVLHDLFTKEMIPIRTAVDFTCQRLPEFYSENKKYLTIDTQTQLIKTLPTTAVPNPGRVGR